MRLFSLTASMPPLQESILRNSFFTSSQFNLNTKPIRRGISAKRPAIICCSNPNSSFSPLAVSNTGPPVIRKRKRYRKPYPGEEKGITEEMRFVAMRLRNIKGKYTHKFNDSDDENNELLDKEQQDEEGNREKDSENDEESWAPSTEGFVKYLVDSKLVFDTIERVVDKSDDVSYTYFRRTGLERSEGLAKDLEWFRQQDIVIPGPSSPGLSYVKYLEELADKSAPLFLCHFYNIYFSHIAGGQVIAKQVSDKILEGRELEFYKWEGDVEELLSGTREKMNKLGEHWSREVKNKCLKEAAKSFKYMGQIIRLIIIM
ncbi:probable inactive heme oxygenase 2, chloroplastic [Euphorbia lathyris]|uniref:probable inactive heme oxygenase 2, chloroplastic n=1 Tax=Euphorbia lathyris TaxID=212925 RepID=UPI0033140599